MEITIYKSSCLGPTYAEFYSNFDRNKFLETMKNYLLVQKIVKEVCKR